MSKELERARAELSKRYKTAIKNAEDEAKQLRLENEALRRENKELQKKYTKLVIFHNLSKAEQEFILRSRTIDELFGEVTNRVYKTGGV